MGEHLTAMPVDYGHKIKKALCHGDVRNVRRIDLPGSRHLHASEQIGIYLVSIPGRRRVALRIDGPKTHQAHEANDAASGDLAPARLKHALDLPVTLVRGAAAASDERLLGGLNRLLLPRLYLVRRRLEALGEFGQRAIAANGGEGYRLKGRTPAQVLREALGRKRLPPVVPMEEKETRKQAA